MSHSGSETSLLAELLPENITDAVSSALSLTGEDDPLCDSRRFDGHHVRKAANRKDSSIKAEKMSPTKENACILPQHRSIVEDSSDPYSTLALGSTCADRYFGDVFLPAHHDAIGEGTLDFPSPGKLVRRPRSHPGCGGRSRKRAHSEEAKMGFSGSYPDNPGKCQVWLDNSWLWDVFDEAGTEMIITKTGRRMFPHVIVAVRGLSPTRQYNVKMRIVAADQYRYKFHDDEWSSVGKGDCDYHSPKYTHRDSPATGAHWQKKPVVFKHIKLTNNRSARSDIVLQSMHKYAAQIIVEDVETKSRETFFFPETAFIAVTAYQNEAVKGLKIEYNPYARAFRESISPDTPNQPHRVGGHAKKMKAAKSAEQTCRKTAQEGLATSRRRVSSSSSSNPRGSETPPFSSTSVSSLESGFCELEGEASSRPTQSLPCIREPLWSSTSAVRIDDDILPTSEATMDDALRRPDYWDRLPDYEVAVHSLTELDSFSASCLQDGSQGRALESQYDLSPLHIPGSVLAPPTANDVPQDGSDL